jgi:predicted nuclease with TOPRIM domain
MSNRIKWTERKFDFGFPTSVYQEMIERLHGTPARIEEYCRSLPTETLTLRADNRWSIQENAGHLLDLESLVQQRIKEYVDGASALHPADMSNRKTYEENHNDKPIEKILNEFRRERTATVEQLYALDAEAFGRSALHPRLNVEMRLVDMLFFQAEHDDYHLTRISELRRSLA